MSKKEELGFPEDYKAGIDAYIAAKLEEAAKSLEEVKAKKKQKKVNPVAEELVTYTFFKDNGEYSDDVFININGEKVVCQRGVPVKIKRKFIWAFERALAQNANVADMISAKEREYNNRSREVGLY